MAVTGISRAGLDCVWMRRWLPGDAKPALAFMSTSCKPGWRVGMDAVSSRDGPNRDALSVVSAIIHGV